MHAMWSPISPTAELGSTVTVTAVAVAVCACHAAPHLTPLLLSRRTRMHAAAVVTTAVVATAAADAVLPPQLAVSMGVLAAVAALVVVLTVREPASPPPSPSDMDERSLSAYVAGQREHSTGSWRTSTPLPPAVHRLCCPHQQPPPGLPVCTDRWVEGEGRVLTGEPLAPGGAQLPERTCLSVGPITRPINIKPPLELLGHKSMDHVRYRSILTRFGSDVRDAEVRKHTLLRTVCVCVCVYVCHPQSGVHCSLAHPTGRCC